MTRIVEILIALNALGGIATFLGFRYAGRKARDRMLAALGKDTDEAAKQLRPEAADAGAGSEPGSRREKRRSTRG